MEIKGDILLDSPPERVWTAVNDPEILATCLPGCRALEPIDNDSTYRAVLELGVAAVKGKYEGTVSIFDMVPPSSYRLKVDVEGLAGFVNAEGSLSLEPVEAKTRLRYTVDVRIGGKLAGVGQRVLGGIAKLLAGRFFSCLERELTHGSESRPKEHA